MAFSREKTGASRRSRSPRKTCATIEDRSIRVVGSLCLHGLTTFRHLTRQEVVASLGTKVQHSFPLGWISSAAKCPASPGWGTLFLVGL